MSLEAELSNRRSLPEAHRSISISGGPNRWRRFLSFAGPGYLISVGYMDPGNWATDLAGGARYGYTLLWVVLVSSLIAMFLQTLCARLGLATGRDLAQTCREHYKKPASFALWLLSEGAIIACDLAEVIGSAVALKLLFHIPLLTGALITGLDVLALLALMRFGFRKLEAVVVVLIGTVAGCFALETFLSHPDWLSVGRGLVHISLPDSAALGLALGILGATVMPHNLYLHSSLVQTRAHSQTPSGIMQAMRYNTLDTFLALGAAFFVNAAILILSAAVFHSVGHVVQELEDAHTLLRPLLGSGAATAFAVALLASGQSSTITGTLAGQIVMEGFLNIKLAPWLRRLITRTLAIIPACILISVHQGHTEELLIFSQVILSLQLPFAVFPLIAFTSDKLKMGIHVNKPYIAWIGYSISLFITGLNIAYLIQSIGILKVAILAAFVLLFSGWVFWGYKSDTKNSVGAST